MSAVCCECGLLRGMHCEVERSVGGMIWAVRAMRSAHVERRPNVTVVEPRVDDQVVDAAWVLRCHLGCCSLHRQRMPEPDSAIPAQDVANRQLIGGTQEATPAAMFDTELSGSTWVMTPRQHRLITASCIRPQSDAQARRRACTEAASVMSSATTCSFSVPCARANACNPAAFGTLRAVAMIRAPLSATCNTSHTAVSHCTV